MQAAFWGKGDAEWRSIPTRYEGADERWQFFWEGPIRVDKRGNESWGCECAQAMEYWGGGVGKTSLPGTYISSSLRIISELGPALKTHFVTHKAYICTRVSWICYNAVIANTTQILKSGKKKSSNSSFISTLDNPYQHIFPMMRVYIFYGKRVVIYTIL